MRVMAFYGKGGIGKSTVVSNLSWRFAKAGARVLQFGCDPKSDSCFNLVPQREVVTVMERWAALGEADLTLEHCLMKGLDGVDALEVGGPPPGTGCGGRGITKAMELVGDPEDLRRRYDVILFDVLGDVVCGGFSAPMRAGYAEEVYIVTSGEYRAMFAANNITQAVKHYARGSVRLGGIVANLRGLDDEVARLEELASLVNTRVVQAIPRDQAVNRAEARRRPVGVDEPDALASQAFDALHAALAATVPSELTVPRPLTRPEFDERFAL